MQTSVDGQTYNFELTTNNSVGYTLNRTYPTTAVEADLLSINYYDNYAFLTYTGWDAEAHSFAFVPEQGSTSYETAVNGLATGAKIKIVNTTTWLNAVQYYDKYYRPLQVIAENHFSGLDRSTNKYNNLRQLIEIRLAHHNQSVIVLRKFEFDTAGRISKIYQNINSAPSDQLVSQYEYNELGQLVDKKLHNTSGSSFLQSVDFRYNIRGWIESINNSQLNINSQNNDETDDYFGMEFLYTKVESGLTASDTLYYNGNIRAIKWKGIGATAGAVDQQSYKFTYDKADRLLKAISQQYTGSAWTKEAGALNEVMTYDNNGNISSLKRRARKHQIVGTTVSYISELVDNLTYTYGTTQGNQLAKVEDAIAVGTGVGDFKNNANITTEYTYNTDGNLTADKNKGIDSVHYNMLGKVRRIKFTDGRVITYLYDGGGNKLKMKTYQGSTLQNTTDYVGGFVYVDGALSFFGSPEGRVVKKGSVFEYEYAIADHQGNTRVVFTSATPAPVAPTATFEGDANDGTSQYINVNASNVVTFVNANHTSGGSKVVRMNQTYKIGPSKSLKVYPGDKVDIEVWEYHEGTSGFGTTSTPLTTLITMVSRAFGGVSGGAGESGLIYNGVNSALNAFVPPGNQGATRPAAYLNYILFDQNYKVLNVGAQLAPATTFTKQKLSFSTLSIKEPGYVFVYLSYDNDSNNWVYFDDFKVTHTKSNVIQYNEYYPFGLQNTNSWTRENNSNNYLYNDGNELITTTGWYDTHFRGYDPILGRFNQTDPLASISSSMTPYNYGFDNPVIYNDPRGDYPEGLCCSGGGGGISSYDSDTDLNGNPFTGGYGYGYGGSYGYNPYRIAPYIFGSVHYGFGGGSSVVTVGNLSINMSQMADGIHTFDFTNGVVTNYTPYSDQQIASMGMEYMGWVTGVNYDPNGNYKEGPRLWESNFGNYRIASAGIRINNFEELGDFIQDGMWVTNTSVGALATHTVYTGKFYKWNEVWHKTKTSGTAWRWQSRWNKGAAPYHRAKQIETVAGARSLSKTLTKIGGALIVADIALSGELKPSHALNAAMLAASTTGVGAIAAGIWFLADFGTMGANYLINGEAKGLGDMLDETLGTYNIYEGVY